MALNREVVAFLACGSLAAFVNWAARIAFSLSMPFEAAVALAYLVGMAVGFVLYRKVVWKTEGAATARQVATFVAVNAASAVLVLGAAVALRLALASILGPHPLVDATAHAAAIAIGAAANFVGHRTFSFRQPA